MPPDSLRFDDVPECAGYPSPSQPTETNLGAPTQNPARTRRCDTPCTPAAARPAGTRPQVGRLPEHCVCRATLRGQGLGIPGFVAIGPRMRRPYALSVAGAARLCRTRAHHSVGAQSGHAGACSSPDCPVDAPSPLSRSLSPDPCPGLPVDALLLPLCRMRSTARRARSA